MQCKVFKINEDKLSKLFKADGQPFNTFFFSFYVNIIHTPYFTENFMMIFYNI